MLEEIDNHARAGRDFADDWFLYNNSGTIPILLEKKR